ncbi:carbohydrate ABC transporter permease [Murimonas intestini]|uniref:Raffinose/stachyose/melibiose transport system permease protein n=1 Tax=Murimonas intestini TaxID=1337051 RepID=A0AB73T0F0_9FIRM|nr:sugar ABC transporter permease [Murimonas intestini]MCR1842351.1 sugar ABC transporter permease [Murimonas intestini]MCR1867726.1 sugar ABC transporter permease [Murimonas intestini]MCR1885962.1 sugar ABC transporter permease [Murimonas intestini]
MNKMLADKKTIFIFTMPCLLFFGLIAFYPVLQTGIKSFYDWDGLTGGTFVGIDNYIKLFQDKLFARSFKNGLLVAGVLVLLQVIVGLFLTLLLLDKRIKCKKFIKTSFFIPVVLSVTAVCQLWSSILNPEIGLINRVLEMLGSSYQQDWLSDKSIAIFVIAFVNAWQYMGYEFVIMYSSANAIPSEYIEASSIDGASRWQTNFRIIIPMMKDTLRTCLIFAVTGGFNIYAQMQLLTQGGPGTATYSLTYMTFRSAFKLRKYGYGCTVAVVLILQCLCALMLINTLLSNKEEEGKRRWRKRSVQ